MEQSVPRRRRRVRGRVAVGCLISPDGKVLLEQKHRNHPNEPGALVFPGGSCYSGESHEAALVRELYEEYGFEFIESDVTRLTGEQPYHTPTGRLYSIVYFLVIAWSGGLGDGTSSSSSVAMGLREALGTLDPRRVRVLTQAIDLAARLNE